MAFVTVTLMEGDRIEIRENSSRALGDRVGCQGTIVRVVNGLDVGVRWDPEDGASDDGRRPLESELTLVDRTLLARYSRLLSEPDFSEYSLR